MATIAKCLLNQLLFFQRPFLSATLSEEEWRVGRQIYKLFLKYTNCMNDRQKLNKVKINLFISLFILVMYYSISFYYRK